MRCLYKFMLILLTAAATACGPSVEHEIIMEEEGWLMVSIEKKISVEELKDFTWYYFDDYGHDNYLQVMFCVPSEYPGYPEQPWARVIIDGLYWPVDDPMITVNIYGTMDEAHKQNLLDITPDMEGVKGKWYYDDPMLESVYFLVENEEDTVMLRYDADGYHEDYRKEWGDPTIETWSDNPAIGPDYEYQLAAGPGLNEYHILPFAEPSFRINEKNELILVDRPKSYKDTSKCVLQPIPF